MLILLEPLAVRLLLMTEVAGDDGFDCDLICRTLGRGEMAEGGPSPSNFRGKTSMTSNFSFRLVWVPRCDSAEGATWTNDGQEGDFVGMAFVVSAGNGLRTAGRRTDVESGNPSRISSKREVLVDKLDKAGDGSIGGSGRRLVGAACKGFAPKERPVVYISPCAACVVTTGAYGNGGR